MNSLKEHLGRYIDAGLSALPAKAGRKQPTVATWKEYQHHRPELNNLNLSGADGTCIVCGAVSGNLELIDFDNGGELYPAWAAIIPPELLQRLVVETSQSGGRHVIYRCDEQVGGNAKLAQGQRDGELKTLIETRGEGGLFVCYPTPGYEMVDGDLADPPTITADERDTLLSAAYSLNEVRPEPKAERALQGEQWRPGDDYNRDADLPALLTLHGWTPQQTAADGNHHWSRPGKSSGTSATLKDGIFYVFSSNAHPFEAGQAYQAFGVYAMLTYGGDYSAAAKALREDGYGNKSAIQTQSASSNRSHDRKPVLTCMSDIDAREVDWLWQDRIAAGRITLLVGMPGAGKSFVTCDLAARISNGDRWPDGAKCKKGSVILVSGEDDPHDTIRPRLDAHAADVNHIYLLSAVNDGKNELMFQLADLDILEQVLQSKPDCRLVIVDPIGTFLGGSTDAHRDNEVRAILGPVAKLAEKYGPAVVIVAHRRKGISSIADDLAIGSRAFTGIARNVWHLMRDASDKDRRLVLSGKTNLAAQQQGLAFHIGGDPAEITWEPGGVDMTADEALALENGGRKQESPAAGEACEWLQGQLSDGPQPAKDLKDAAKDDAIAERTLNRAKKMLGVESRRDGEAGKWEWFLPGCDLHGQQDCQGSLGLGNVATLPPEPAMAL